MRHDQIQPGSYLGTVTGSALGRASNGTEQIVVGFDVHFTDPETGNPVSLPMTWYGFFTDKALATTDKALAALGFDPTTRDISDLHQEEPHLSPIVGATANLVIEIEEDQDGNPRPRIRWVNRQGGGLAVKERLDPLAAKAFGAGLRKRLLAARGPVAGASRPAPAGARPGAPAVGHSAQPAQASRPAASHSAPRGAAAPASASIGGDVDYDDIPF